MSQHGSKTACKKYFDFVLNLDLATAFIDSPGFKMDRYITTGKPRL